MARTDVCLQIIDKQIIFVYMTKNGEYVNRRSYHRKRNNDRRIVRKPLLQHSLSLPARWRSKGTRWRSKGIYLGINTILVVL